MMKQTMGIDIDGTLTEYDSFIPYFNELLGKQVKPEEIIQYDLHEIFDMEYDAFANLFDEHSAPSMSNPIHDHVHRINSSGLRSALI